MSNRFVVIDDVKDKISLEGVYENLANSILQNLEINKTLKQFQNGLEAYNSISDIYDVISKSELTPALESSLINSLKYYKDLVGDYSLTISLENYNSPKLKKSIALEGLGSFLKSIWEAIINFFKRIWNWITGGSSKGSSSSDTGTSSEDTKKTIEENKKEFEELKKKHDDDYKKEKELEKQKQDKDDKEYNDFLKENDKKREELITNFRQAVAEKIKYISKFRTIDDYYKHLVGLNSDLVEALETKTKELVFINNNYIRYIENNISKKSNTLTDQLVLDSKQSRDIYNLISSHGGSFIYDDKILLVSALREDSALKYSKFIKEFFDKAERDVNLRELEIKTNIKKEPSISIEPVAKHNDVKPDISVEIFFDSIPKIDQFGISKIKARLEKNQIELLSLNADKVDTEDVFKKLKITNDDVYLTEEESSGLDYQQKADKQTKKISDSVIHSKYRKELTYFFNHVLSLSRDINVLRNAVKNSIDLNVKLISTLVSMYEKYVLAKGNLVKEYEKFIRM